MTWISIRLLQMNRKLPSSQRDYAAHDSGTALVKLRIWWFQVLPLFYDRFPDWYLWRCPVIRYVE